MGGRAASCCSRSAWVRSVLTKVKGNPATILTGAIWFGRTGRSSTLIPAELTSTIAATVTTNIRPATRRLRSRKSLKPDPGAEFGSPRRTPRPPTSSLSWLRTDMSVPRSRGGPGHRVLVAVVGLYDPLHERVAHDVLAGEGVEDDARDVPEDVAHLEQARLLR